MTWLYRKIKNRIRLYRDKGLSLVLAVGLRVRDPRLVALALAGFTRPLDDVPKGNMRYRVLCINRRIFTDDIKALNTQATHIEFLLIHYNTVKQVYRKLMPNPDIISDKYVEYIRLHPEQHETLLRFWNKVLLVWQSRLQFDAVLNSSFMHSNQVEFAKACVARGIPYIALHKDAFLPPNQFRTMLESRYIKWHFYGTRVLTINERIAEDFLQIPGITKKNNTPVGIPRTDVLFQPNSQESIYISLFLSLPAQKLFVSDEVLEARLVERLDEFYVTFIKLADELPESSFVIKLKQGTLYRNYFDNLVQQYALRLGQNVTVISGIEPAVLLRVSKLVLSYNSTVLFEALALGKPIAEPDLRDLLTSDDYFGDGYAQMTNFVTSREDLVRLIQNPEAYVGEPALREQVLRQYLYRTDGKAAERINNILVAEIEKARQRTGQ